MEKYMLVFHNVPMVDEVYANMSPEQMQAELAFWNTWIGGLAAQGKFVSSDALEPSGKIVRGSKKVVTDGPFTEGKELVSGYLMLKAESMEEAVQHSFDCPVLAHEGTVEVRKVLEYN